MGPTIAREGGRLHVLADAFEASAYLKDELARDPASASRAVLWLSYPAGEEGNSAASSSLIKQGIAQVSLVRQPPQLSREAGNTESISGVAVGALAGDGGGGDANRLWLPATVLPIDVECPRNSQQHGWRQLRTTSSSSSRSSSNRLLSSSPARTAPHDTPVNGGKQPQEYSRPRQQCSAFLSPCLAEALGLPSVVVAAAAVNDSSGSSESSVGLFPPVVELSIRELPASLVMPAASVDLSGPYPMVAAAGSSTGVGNPPPVAQPLSPPPPSLVAAVSSILPYALEGEVLSAGSVVHVTVLFAFVVTGVWAEGDRERRMAVDKVGGEEGEEPEHAQRSMPSTGDGVGAVVRAHVATELRLLPPSPSTRARPCGVVLGEGATPAAAAASAGGGLTIGYPGHQRFGITTTVTTPAGRQQEDGADTSTEEPTVSGTEGCPTSRLPPSAAAAAAAAVRPTPPGPGPPDPRQQWVQRVGQDFGGQPDKVAATVATVRSALWGKEVGGVGAVGGGGGGGRMGLAAPSSGLLLHGPTGVGKTLLARSVAEHSGAPWFFLDCASVFRRERGEAEKYVQNFLGKASRCSPSVVVLDQVESLCRKRPEAAGITELQVFSVLLEQMDSFRRPPSLPRVFFLATCPDPTTLDPSLLQRGRLESVLRLGQLDSTGRASILRIHTRGMLLQLLPRPLVVAAGKDSDSSKNALATKGAAPGKDCDVGVAEKNTSDPDIHQAGAVEAPVSASGSGGGTPSSPCGEENDVGRVSVTAVNRRAAAEAAGSAAVVVSVAVTRSLPPPPPQPQPGTREKFLRLVSAKCHGYLGSDLERLCREAALHHMASFKSAAARTRAASASPPKRLPAQEGFRATTAAAVAREEDPADRDRRQEFGLAAGGVREESWSGGEVGEGGVSLQDFWAALDVVRPASLVGHSVGMRAGNGGAEGAALVGCDEAMAELRAFLLTPLENPSLLRNLGIRAATGALLHGPPGCGKTSVARALAQESRGVANFLEVRCSDLVDKVVGRSERAVSDLFAAARASAPCILFLDQVEGVAARRGYHSSTEQTFDRILSTLLIEMDGVMSESGGHVVVLAATNDIASLDPALLRPGRLDRRIHLRAPDSTARTTIFLQRLLAMPLQMERSGLGREGGSGNHAAAGSLADDPAATGENKDGALCEGERKPEQSRNRSCTSTNPNNNSTGGGSELPRQRRGLLDTCEAYAAWLASETEGGSGADVTGVCREAALAALRENIEAREVAPRHFEAALRGQRPRVVVGGGGGP